MRSHTGKNGRKANFWAPAIGVLALGALTYSLNLEGAVVRDKAGRDRTLNTVRDVSAGGAAQATNRVRYGRVVQNSYRIAAPIVVDYRDDEGTRLRREGKLIGPMPIPALNRGGACSFKADCDDGNPCTDDRCDIGPGEGEGDGTCSHDPIADGEPGDCDDGVYCNGAETCDGAVIGLCQGTCAGGPTPGAVCETDAAHGDGCGGGTCGGKVCVGGPTPGAACTYHSTCTAVLGTCTNGTTPCPGEICQEEDEGGTDQSPFQQQGSCRPTACAANADCNDNDACSIDRCCIAGQLSALKICSNATGVGTAGGVEIKTCNVNGDCGAGTCLTVEVASACGTNGACDNSASPCGAAGDCTAKTCRTAGATFNGLACDTIADCGTQPGRQCVTGSVCFLGRCCDTPAVCTRETYNNCNTKWYAGDEGRLDPPANSACGAGTLCPRYGSGIGNAGSYTVIAPRTSLSTQAESITGLVINKLGDDYELDTGVNTYLEITELRFVGGVTNTANSRTSFEFYDESGNFVEDIFFITNQTELLVQTVEFLPPMTIPSKGYVVAHVLQAFASPDINSPGEFQWVGTDAVDHGTNVAGSLWLNNGVAGSDILKACVGGLDAGTLCSINGQCQSNVCGNVPEVLSFEIEGTVVVAPTGACCNPANATCTQNVPWLCEGGGGIFLAAGQDCNVCSSNSPSAGIDCAVNADCRQCTSGAEIGLPCTVAADCTGNGSSFCVGGSNNNGACTIQANCPGGLCVPVACSGTCVTSCGTGACCITATGVCTTAHATAGACTGAGGVWQGFGSDCNPNCCTQPTTSGADHCEDAQVHVISVPDPLVPPAELTVTITGNNATASSTVNDEDSCYPPSVPGAELGWYEAFSINDCAYVRLDHCCTDPTKIPSYRILYDNCPCGASMFTTANPNIPGEGPDSRGAPYCDEDNGWNNFGPLTAGTYYYPVLSFLGGNFGQYQFHVTVKACPLAACCYNKCVGGANDNDNCTVNGDCPGGTCTGVCELLNILDCADRSGSFLGPPNRATAVTICGSVCNTGSCCTGPGECIDDTIPGSGFGAVNKAFCDAQPGKYVGGFRCFGGVCSGGADAGESCSLNADCTGGTCSGSVEELQQPSPCPVCEIGGAENCQLWDDSTNLRPSDLTAEGGGQRTADDFQPVGNTINTVCAWGVYFEPNLLGTDSDDCADDAVDSFHVVVYNNDATLDIPNFASIAGQSNVTSMFKAEQVNCRITQPPFESRCWAYQLALDTQISGLIPGNRYWLEVTNDTELPVDNKCFWNWQGLTNVYNDYSANGSGGGGYGLGAARTGDQAFCLDVDFTSPPAPVRACCACDGSCSEKTKVECDIEQGRWLIGSADCSPNPCGGGGPPPNNNCLAVAAGSATPGGDVLFTNRCATTDGPNPLPTELNASGETMNADVWWKYIAECSGELTVATCGSGATAAGADLDTFLAVYHDDTAPTTCVCPNVGNQIALLWPAGLGNDEGCVGFPFGAGGVVNGAVDAGDCYMVRVGGFAGQGGESGDGILTMICGSSGSPSPTPGNDLCVGGGNNGLPCSKPADCPGGQCYTKNRYVSITPSVVATASASPTVIQLTATALPAALAALVGDVWYAGAPTVENEGPPGGTFKAAPLVCGGNPGGLRDWGAEGVVHLFGSIIVPGGTYEIRACTAVGVGCSDPPLVVNTAKYGDCTPPIFVSQPNFIDVSAVVDKFQGDAGSISKTRAKMQPATVNNAASIGFLDISEVVNAFKGFAYNFAGVACP